MVSTGLVRSVYLDTLDEFIDDSRGERVNHITLLHQSDKLHHVDGSGLLLVQFSVQLSGFVRQRVLFVLVGLGQLILFPN